MYGVWSVAVRKLRVYCSRKNVSVSLPRFLYRATGHRNIRASLTRKQRTSRTHDIASRAKGGSAFLVPYTVHDNCLDVLVGLVCLIRDRRSERAGHRQLVTGRTYHQTRIDLSNHFEIERVLLVDPIQHDRSDSFVCNFEDGALRPACENTVQYDPTSNATMHWRYLGLRGRWKTPKPV